MEYQGLFRDKYKRTLTIILLKHIDKVIPNLLLQYINIYHIGNYTHGAIYPKGYNKTDYASIRILNITDLDNIKVVYEIKGE